MRSNCVEAISLSSWKRNRPRTIISLYYAHMLVEGQGSEMLEPLRLYVPFSSKSSPAACVRYCCTFISGALSYLLTLVPDGMRGIRNILFEKAAAAVLTSCVRV